MLFVNSAPYRKDDFDIMRYSSLPAFHECRWPILQKKGTDPLFLALVSLDVPNMCNMTKKIWQLLFGCK